VRFCNGHVLVSNKAAGVGGLIVQRSALLYRKTTVRFLVFGAFLDCGMEARISAERDPLTARSTGILRTVYHNLPDAQFQQFK